MKRKIKEFRCPACSGTFKKRPARYRLIDGEYVHPFMHCPRCHKSIRPIKVKATPVPKKPKRIPALKPEQIPNYYRYIDSWAWQRKRRIALHRDGGLCRSCSKPGNHVHHITYDRLGDEDSTDLVTLCVNCHKQEHKNFSLQERENFWREQNDLLNGLLEPSRFARKNSTGTAGRASQKTQYVGNASPAPHGHTGNTSQRYGQ